VTTELTFAAARGRRALWMVAVALAVGGCAGPTEPGTDGNAVYRGAFIRTAPTIWTTGWTVLNMAGLMAN